MPVEIRELVIRVRVEDQPPAASPIRPAASGAALGERELQRIIAACAEQVLKILENQKER